MFEQRIVQLGWFVQDLSSPDADTEHGEIIIRLDDFQISAKATKLHGVSNELAQHDGVPLRSAWNTFMGAMKGLEQRGASSPSI